MLTLSEVACQLQALPPLLKAARAVVRADRGGASPHVAGDIELRGADLARLRPALPRKLLRAVVARLLGRKAER
jgi:hypothetical protein